VLGVNAIFIMIWLRFALAAYMKKIKDLLSAKKKAAEDAKAKKRNEKQKLIDFNKDKDAENSPAMKEVKIMFGAKNTKRLRRQTELKIKKKGAKNHEE
jgi:hypothetical protein